jgi:hypothetical protein
MRLKAKKRSIWIEAGAVILVMALAVAAFVRSETKPMDRDELKIDAANLRSLASGGDQLTGQFLDGRLTETFFHEQASLMRDNVKNTRKQIESSQAESELELKRWETGHLAQQLEGELSALSSGSRHPGQIRSELAALFTQLKQMEDSLKQ